MSILISSVHVHVDLMCNLYNRLMFVQFDDQCVREGTEINKHDQPTALLFCSAA